MQLSVGSENISVSIGRPLVASEIRNVPASLLDQQRARQRIPRTYVVLTEGVKPSTRYVGER